MSISRPDALAAEARLILSETQKAIDLDGSEIMQGAAARGQFNSGGTVRRLVNSLLEHSGRAADRLINAHVKAGDSDPGLVAKAARDVLQPGIDAFFSTYASRNPGGWSAAFESMRSEVAELLNSLTDRATVALATYPRAIEDVIATRVPGRLLPSWDDRIQRTLEKAKQKLSVAKDEEDFQSVGLFCREVIISVGQAVYEPSRHPPLDATVPSETDAKRQLDAYFAFELAGDAHEPMRKHARSALNLANSLQHKRTPTFRHACVCLEATTSVVSIVAIVFGTRGAE